MLDLDLNLCENGERFQHLCFRLARSEFPDCMPLSVGSWDNGMDIIEFPSVKEGIKKIWQCKFTKQNKLSSIKKKIADSLNSLQLDKEVEWILCLSIEKTGSFVNWLFNELKKYPLIKSFKIWDKIEILMLLEKYPKILEIFFYRSYAELSKYFTTEELSLIDLKIDNQCSWITTDPKVLRFCRKDKNQSDLLLDIIIKNIGNSEAMIYELNAEVIDVHRVLRGFPGDDLLISKITYEISINDGQEGIYNKRLEPPLLVKPHSYQRFTIKVTDIGFAWIGKLGISILYGNQQSLRLPTILIAV